MANYLLLRNNTQSGPLSFDDLLKNGLKPYDLVWVQGKSAAWRYPSEIEELKPYAPAVEEQPYDRFYKKAAQPKQEAVIAPVQVTEQVKEKPVVVQESIAIEEKYEKYIPKKSVFVTLPGHPSTGSGFAQKPQEPVTKQQEPVVKPQVSQVLEPAPAPAPIITVTENPEAAKIKFSQPLDEIKEMYVKTLQQRKSKIARKSFLLANLKRAAVILGLVTLGILAGLAIKSESGNDTLAQESIQGTIPTSAALPNIPSGTTGEEPGTETNNSPNTIIPSTTDIQEPDPQPLPPQVKQQLEAQEEKELLQPRVRKEEVAAPPVDRQRYERPQPVERDPVTGERSKQVRSETSDDRPVAKNIMAPRKSGLENMVSVTSNDYKRVAFGGIRNLELTVTNDSRFVLDKVVVELQYLKPSEEPLKTELVRFQSVSPNGTMTMKIKDTNRGIKVAYKIIDIQAQQTETALRE